MGASLRFKSINDIGKHCRIRNQIPVSINMNCSKKSPLTSAQGGELPKKKLTPDESRQKKEAESRWQKTLFDLLVQDGLTPVWEFKKAIPGRKFRVDIAFPVQRICIEIDGWQHHGKTLSAFKSDRTRQNLFVVHGWRVLRFFPGEISKTPLDCIATIKLALSAK